MSSTEITEVEYYGDNSLDIKYTIPATSSWNNNSQYFYINNKKEDKCFLNMICSILGGNYTYNLELSINFLNEGSFNPNVEFEVTIWFNNTSLGHTFKLVKNSNKNIYNSSKCTFYDNTFQSYSQINVYVKISYKNMYNTDDKRFTNSFKNLLVSEEHADLKIKVTNNTFNVHKCIISSRCNVLKKMIETDMIEKKNGEIMLSAWDPIVVKEVLTYIYTNNCKITKMPHELFKLAHYLELTELELNCSEYLLNHINLKNIISTLELTDMEQYELKEMKRVANNFVSQHEATLANDLEFQDYLMNCIQTSNVHHILRIAKTHNLTEVLSNAMEFLRLNYKEVLKNEECKKFLLSEANLLLSIYEYSSDSYTAQLKKMKNNNED